MAMVILTTTSSFAYDSASRTSHADMMGNHTHTDNFKDNLGNTGYIQLMLNPNYATGTARYNLGRGKIDGLIIDLDVYYKDSKGKSLELHDANVSDSGSLKDGKVNAGPSGSIDEGYKQGGSPSIYEGTRSGAENDYYFRLYPASSGTFYCISKFNISESVVFSSRYANASTTKAQSNVHIIGYRTEQEVKNKAKTEHSYVFNGCTFPRKF